mmetsp:Transcript_13823/g.36250  ORF Transcript_13823/g.36250 Transcript_13823/m.36250 type:complete len:244 (+) Transcript_13823:454-1185(+)
MLSIWGCSPAFCAAITASLLRWQLAAMGALSASASPATPSNMRLYSDVFTSIAAASAAQPRLVMCHPAWRVRSVLFSRRALPKASYASSPSLPLLSRKEMSPVFTSSALASALSASTPTTYVPAWPGGASNSTWSQHMCLSVELLVSASASASMPLDPIAAMPKLMPSSVRLLFRTAAMAVTAASPKPHPWTPTDMSVWFTASAAANRMPPSSPSSLPPRSSRSKPRLWPIPSDSALIPFSFT